MLHMNSDKVKLQWGVYKVRDRYHAIACFHCQRLGHVEANCSAKVNGDDPCCFKCGGNHKSVDCTGGPKKCINCERYKKTELNHMATYYGCPILANELDKIRGLTDHGF